jgi:hypothetical protein
VLAAQNPRSHPAGVFVVTEVEAAAIRAVYEERGESPPAVPWRDGQREGTGVRRSHRRLAAAAGPVLVSVFW